MHQPRFLVLHAASQSYQVHVLGIWLFLEGGWGKGAATNHPTDKHQPTCCTQLLGCLDAAYMKPTVPLLLYCTYPPLSPGPRTLLSPPLSLHHSTVPPFGTPPHPAVLLSSLPPPSSAAARENIFLVFLFFTTSISCRSFQHLHNTTITSSRHLQRDLPAKKGCLPALSILPRSSVPTRCLKSWAPPTRLNGLYTRPPSLTPSLSTSLPSFTPTVRSTVPTLHESYHDLPPSHSHPSTVVFFCCHHI